MYQLVIFCFEFALSKMQQLLLYKFAALPLWLGKTVAMAIFICLIFLWHVDVCKSQLQRTPLSTIVNHGSVWLAELQDGHVLSLCVVAQICLWVSLYCKGCSWTVAYLPFEPRWDFFHLFLIRSLTFLPIVTFFFTLLGNFLLIWWFFRLSRWASLEL